MNYLAHFLLADPDEDLMFGNYIGDGVKGSFMNQYSNGIIRGIKLHRFIDTYTDSHALVLAAKKLFYPTQSKYSGVVVDVLFDHILALNWNQYHEESLDFFAQRCYNVVSAKHEQMPQRSRSFYNYMVMNNMLVNYARLEGITQVFKGMDARTKYNSNMTDAIYLPEHQLSELVSYFEVFFPELIEACNQWKQEN